MRRDLSTWLGTLRSTGRTAKYRRSNRPLKARGASSQISLAGGEPLDQRKMLAVTALLSGSTFTISLGANDDVAGLVRDGADYKVYDGASLVATQTASVVDSIVVEDTGTFSGQVFEVRDGGTINAALEVKTGIEKTRIYDDVNVTQPGTVAGGRGVFLGSEVTILDDASPGDALLIGTLNTGIQFTGVSKILDGSQVQVDTGSGAGDIEFIDDILGEDGAGTLTLTAGTGAISFGGTIGGAGLGEDLGGVLINSAASVSATGKFYLDGSVATAFDNGLTIADGVNNVNLLNGGEITNFGEGGFGIGIYFQGSSTNSTVAQFKVWNNDVGMQFGADGGVGQSDLSGTVVDNNDVYGNTFDGIDIFSVAGNLNGEDAFVIGGVTGNSIYGNGYDGIYATSSTGVEITNNLIYNNGYLSSGSGINLEGGGEYLISGNAIGEDAVGPYPSIGNAVNGITIDGEDGFYSYAGTVVEGNTIKYNEQYGVRVEGVTLDTGEDSILIFQNTIVFNGLAVDRAVPDVGGIRIDGSENIRIIDNAIGNNGVLAPGNGIDIVNGSAGTIVLSNTIGGNTVDGIYLGDSSTDLNPTKIGAVLPAVASNATLSTVTLAGDQRASILAGQRLALIYQTDLTDVTTITFALKTVDTVSYSAITGDTTVTLVGSFSDVPFPPVAVSLGNYINNNGQLDAPGNGINVYASGVGEDGVVAGLEIVGNVVVGNAADGIHLEGASSDGEDLTNVLIQGNFVGFDRTRDLPDGNGEDGIYLRNGSYVSILQNYVAHNGDPNPSNEDENGIAIVTSHHIDIGEDGLGNYVYQNANDGVDIKSSRFINIFDNEIAFNGDDGIDIRAVVGVDTPRSQDILVEGNWIHDNGGSGIEIADADRVEAVDNLIAGNAADGVNSLGSTGVTVAFNIIRDQGGDGVEFRGSTGVIEGNEIYANGEDGVYAYGGDAFNGIVDVLGNIIRENGDDGVEFRGGYFGYDVFNVDDDGRLFSVVGGNTIERNVDDGVTLVNVGGVQVGGRFPSDINFINLNGASGICVSGGQPIETPSVSNGVWVLGNEIDSNEEYGVCLDGAEDIVVGGGPGNGGFDYDQYAGPEAANTIRRNGIAGVFAQGVLKYAEVINNDISENPVGVMITSASGYSGYGPFGGGLTIGGPSYPDFPAEDSEIGTLGNRIVDNGEGIRATGDCYGTFVTGNLIEDNLTGVTLAGVRGLSFGYGEDVPPPRSPLPIGEFGNTVQNNNEGLRGSGDLTDTVVVGNTFLDNTKVGIALQSAKNLTVGGAFGEDVRNVISGSPIGLSASGTMTGTQVINNQLIENTIGIALSKATGMTVGGNTIDGSTKYGISVTGNNAGTTITDNTVRNTGSAPGIGISLNSARNVEVIGNTVAGSALAGLYATGNTVGTVVHNNYFTDNRIGMYLENATNAVFGGLGEDEGNTIIGGSDVANGVLRDGIVATGTLTGSSITGTDMTDTSTGVWLRDAQGIDVNNTLITASESFGLYANGTLTGSKFHDNLITGTTGVNGANGHAMSLAGAQGLAVYDNIGEDSFGAGIFVSGDTTGTTVTSNLFDGNRSGITLVDATNAVIGGLGEDEGNVVIGGSDIGNGKLRDGIQVVGTSTGSQVLGTVVSDTSTGVYLGNATGVNIEGGSITGSEAFGVYATGTLTGSTVQDLLIDNAGGLGFYGDGIHLANATGLTVTGNTGEDNFGGGLYVTGDTSGTVVENNDFIGNRAGIILVNATNAVIGAENQIVITANRTTADGLGNNSVYGAYADGSTVYAATGGGLSISTDGGVTFTNRTTAAGLGGNDVRGVYAVGSTVYAAVAGGLSISTDGGATFTNRTTAAGLGSNDVTGVYAVGSTVYAATQGFGGGLAISTDGGATFTNRTTANGLGAQSVYGVFAVGSTVYAATGGGLSISTDGGATFTNRTTAAGLGGNSVYGVYAVGSTVYAATFGGLSISTDGGATFTNYTTAAGLGSNDARGVFAVGSKAYAATAGGLSLVDTIVRGNRIVGGGDASTGDYRDGIVAQGTLTGSSITNTTITNAATGILLNDATGLTIDTAIVTLSQVFGMSASGTSTNTQVNTSTFSSTSTTAGGGTGVLLQAAQFLTIQDATITSNEIGLYATGDCSGTEVLDTTWVPSNTTDLINNSTGTPPLDIDPLP